MKRSQQGCRACAAKAHGASTWVVGYIAGVEDTSSDEDETELCALHMRLVREAAVKAEVYRAKTMPGGT